MKQDTVLVGSASRALLWACIEDYVGLWELRWELNGYHEGFGDDGHLREARERVTYLLRQGWVEVFWCEEPYGQLHRAVPDDTDANVALLGDDARWELPPDGGWGVRLSATPAGEAAYRAGS